MIHNAIILGGALIVGIRMPSTNRSIYSKKHYKHTFILFGQDGTNPDGSSFHGFTGPFRKIIGFVCSSHDGSKDNCRYSAPHLVMLL